MSYRFPVYRMRSKLLASSRTKTLRQKSERSVSVAVGLTESGAQRISHRSSPLRGSPTHNVDR